jgi:hypothetical protein
MVMRHAPTHAREGKWVIEGYIFSTGEEPLQRLVVSLDELALC